MKIKNIFKKLEKTVTKANIQKLEKNQLEKLVGGAETLKGKIKDTGGDPILLGN